jgi:hypothetical protein
VYDADAQSLLQRLIAEWKKPDPKAEQPVILEERERPDRSIYVYVIWDDWGPLSAIERSEIVMNAFEKRYGLKESLNVRSAMGLTSREADHLGIK